ncbi:MAG: hypothetical protein H6822_19550 [Planctomycetaceae bacterium]|nr:hypothetical protein [Planctomycetales bacterium]MCB9924383.1 hypothetical protein [Planctomycetaceae bacterium]
MLAPPLAAAIGQVEDVAEPRDRWEIAESVYNDEISRYDKSTNRTRKAIRP